MNNDRQLCISTGASRKATSWQGQSLLWSEFVQRLSQPVRTMETLAEYKSLPKPKQDSLKDVGGFVGGTLKGGRRKNENADRRCLVTLDADTIEPGGTSRVLQAVEGLGCAYAVYSTRKHEGAAPRLRIILPLDRDCSADEYEPVARKAASFIGMEIFDPTTFESVRLMYWPSCSADSEFVFTWADRPFLSASGVLAMYTDWRDVGQWPEVPGAARIRDRSAKKQGDPLEKKGVVGAFCRVYGIQDAMDAFLPGIYEPCGGGRFTYSGGSTVGGAVLYEGKFLYSHHATDPCSGKLCNAFDMVRLHLFGEEDLDADPETPVNRLPSYAAMSMFALEQEKVALLMTQERYEAAASNFTQQPVPVTQEDLEWTLQLKVNPQTNRPISTINNVLLILRNDPKLKGRMYLDDFSERIMVGSPLPWEVFEYPYRPRMWTDADDSGLRNYVEFAYGITGKERIGDALLLYTGENRKNHLKDYLQSLEWDGQRRLDRLLVDYLGAEDTRYNREAIRKALVAAVARVFRPGCKFDYMLILTGPQGIGKTTFFAKLGMGWFSDSLNTFEGKDAAELLQGYWIIEAGELTGMNRSEMNAVKQFLSKQEDVYRAAYAKNTTARPRRCIIVGTTNESEFLRDNTGNRRFWPVDVYRIMPVKSIWNDLAGDVGQIWAEAVCLYRAGEPLVLSKEAAEEAAGHQEEHREGNAKEGIIQEFLEKEVPVNWYQLDADARRFFTSDGSTAMVKRDKVCVAEIWCECFRQPNTVNLKRADSVEITKILSHLPGWERAKSTLFFGAQYGHQKGFRRTGT